MKAIAIKPGTPDSVRLRELPRPSLDKVPGRPRRARIDDPCRPVRDRRRPRGRAYGVAPPGEEFLVLGHAVATIGQAQADEHTHGWLDELLTGRIEGFDATAIARHLPGAGDHVKATVEIA